MYSALLIYYFALIYYTSIYCVSFFFFFFLRRVYALSFWNLSKCLIGSLYLWENVLIFLFDQFKINQWNCLHKVLVDFSIKLPSFFVYCSVLGEDLGKVAELEALGICLHNLTKTARAESAWCHYFWTLESVEEL